MFVQYPLRGHAGATTHSSSLYRRCALQDRLSVSCTPHGADTVGLEWECVADTEDSAGLQLQDLEQAGTATEFLMHGPAAKILRICWL